MLHSRRAHTLLLFALPLTAAPPARAQTPATGGPAATGGAAPSGGAPGANAPVPGVAGGVPNAPVPTGKPLTLADVVNTAVGGNSGLVLARQRLQKAQELIIQVRAQGRPQFRADAADTYTTYNAFAPVLPNPTVTNPTPPGGGQIPVVVDNGNGFSTSYLGGGGGGNAPTTGAALPTTGLTAGPSVGGPAVSPTGTTGIGGVSGTGGTSPLPTAPSTAAPASPGAPAAPIRPAPPVSPASPSAPAAPVTGAFLPPLTTGYSMDSDPARVAAAETPARQPRVDSTGGGSGGTTNPVTGIEGRSGVITGQRNNYAARVSASQLIDLFGLLPAAKNVQENVRDFYSLDIERLGNETALAAKNLFFNVLLNEAQVTTQQEQVRYAVENVRITGARLRQGIVSRFDVLTAQTALSAAQQQLIAAQNGRDLAQADVSQTQAAAQQALAGVSSQQSNLAQAEANASRGEAQYQQARTDLARAQAAQAQEASAQQRSQLAQAKANLTLAQVTARRYQNLLSEGAIDQQTTDQAVASFQSNQANVQALSASLRASLANVKAFTSAVGSSRANVKAYADGIRAGQAAVGAAAANVRASRAAANASAANIRAAQANVARLASLQGFNRVTAPFSGVITARNVDAGAFISSSGGPLGGGSSVGDATAGTSTQGAAASGNPLGGGSSPGGGGQSGSLFSLAQTNALRVYVNIPQTYIGVVSTGQPVDMTVQELPGQKFKGTISRAAGALDPSSRTLVSEVRLQNPKGTLIPGMFAQVHLHVPHPPGSVIIPGGALLTNANGTQVILVDKNSKLHFQPITLGRDLGKTLEVTQGLSVGQPLVATPSDDLKEGQSVHTTPAPPSP